MNVDLNFTDAYDFELPPELIAQSHAHPRDASRLLVLRAESMAHACFADLTRYLRFGDVLVLNETRVVPARLFAKTAEGADVELLLMHPSGGERFADGAVRWWALAKPARKLRVGDRLSFGSHGCAHVLSSGERGLRELRFELGVPIDRFLAEAGRLPLPPYIHADGPQAQLDYQTVFARVPGSVAAPTASLHFTPALLSELERCGVRIAKLTLDVGAGTFRPITAKRLDDHAMHREYYSIGEDAAKEIRLAQKEGRRIIAAGTTVMRALEGCANTYGQVDARDDSTDLFIRPGFEFRVVDALITNFHTPRSSLLVLVSAFAGRERIASAYAEAVRERYRFFSFGDAMLIEP